MLESQSRFSTRSVKRKDSARNSLQMLRIGSAISEFQFSHSRCDRRALELLGLNFRTLLLPFHNTEFEYLLLITVPCIPHLRPPPIFCPRPKLLSCSRFSAIVMSIAVPAHEVLKIPDFGEQCRDAPLQQCFDVRIAVFVHEQGFPLEVEIDE